VRECVGELLDRQAAITRRECSPEAIDYMLNTIGELEEQVDELSGKMEAEHSLRLHWKAQAEELTAERGRLQERNDRQGKTIDELKVKIDELTAELDARRMRERAAEYYDFRAATERWERAFEDKCGEVVRLTAERDQLSRNLEAEHALVVQFEYDNEELRHANNPLRASVAGLKSTVERFKARESREPADMGN
jgi:chromosome segregation ATPase